MLWNSPAFKAGIVVGTQIVAVNGSSYDADDLKDATTAAKSNGAAIQPWIKRGDRYNTAALNYRGGLRYPHLQRIPGTSALIDNVLNPKA